MSHTPSTELTFSLYPLDKKFVPPKPQNSVADEKVTGLEQKDQVIFTRKRDGHYVSAVVVDGRACIYSRGEVKDLTANFPHIEQELLKLQLPPGGTLFCCELIAENDGGDNREFVARLTKTSAEKALEMQKQDGFARLMVFNVLVLGGRDVSGDSNVCRLATVEGLTKGFNHIFPVEILSGSFESLQQLVRKKGWEGMVVYAADGKSAYRLDGNEDNPPRPNGCWKRKPIYEDDFIAIGWVAGSAGKRHANRMGKLLLAQIDAITGAQIPCGEVGIGFSDAERESLAKDSLYPCVVQVEFERRFPPRKISGGKKQCALCNPRFVRLRDDKRPNGCRLPENLSSLLNS